MLVNTFIYFPWYNGVVGLTPYPHCVYDHGIIYYIIWNSVWAVYTRWRCKTISQLLFWFDEMFASVENNNIQIAFIQINVRLPVSCGLCLYFLVYNTLQRKKILLIPFYFPFHSFATTHYCVFEWKWFSSFFYIGRVWCDWRDDV